MKRLHDTAGFAEAWGLYRSDPALVSALVRVGRLPVLRAWRWGSMPTQATQPSETWPRADRVVDFARTYLTYQRMRALFAPRRRETRRAMRARIAELEAQVAIGTRAAESAHALAKRAAELEAQVASLGDQRDRLAAANADVARLNVDLQTAAATRMRPALIREVASDTRALTLEALAELSDLAAVGTRADRAGSAEASFHEFVHGQVHELLVLLSKVRCNCDELIGYGAARAAVGGAP